MLNRVLGRPESRQDGRRAVSRVLSRKAIGTHSGSKEHWRRVCQQDWPRQAAALWAENGIWQDKNAPIVWRLDGSEGPLRMR